MNVYSELRSQPTGIHKLSAAKANQRDRLLTIDFVLVAGFSMLGLFAAIEPLRRANSLSEKEVFRFRLTSWDGSPVVCAAGFSIPVDAQFDEVDFADITFVCAGAAPESNIPAQLPDHIRKLWRRGKTVGGLCGGTFALAKAGILSGKRFTLHWEHYAVFVSRWPEPRCMVPRSSGTVFCRLGPALPAILLGTSGWGHLVVFVCQFRSSSVFKKRENSSPCELILSLP